MTMFMLYKDVLHDDNVYVVQGCVTWCVTWCWWVYKLGTGILLSSSNEPVLVSINEVAVKKWQI